MKQKLTQKEEAYIRLLLKSEPIPDKVENKKWLDNHVKTLLDKYNKSKKLEVKLSKIYKSSKANEVKLKTYLENAKRSSNR